MHVCTILIVDDDEGMRELYKSMLGKNTTWKIDYAANAVQALELFQAKNHDVVISDFEMEPGPTGLTLLRCVRYISPSTPVMLVSGHNPNRFESEGIPYLTKPIRSQKLVEIISLMIAARL